MDIFEIENLQYLKAVEMLAWRMKEIAELLKGKIVEIGTDATCKGKKINLKKRKKKKENGNTERLHVS